MAHSIVLPNMLANWKWPRRINPHYDEVKQASAAWLAGFGAFSPRAQHAFDRCDFGMWIAVSSLAVVPPSDSAPGRLASLAYPRLAKGKWYTPLLRSEPCVVGHHSNFELVLRQSTSAQAAIS